MPLPRYNMRQLLTGMTLLIGIVLLGRFVVWPLVYPLTPWHWDRVGDVYALWQTEEMLAMHMATSKGVLPTRWEDLTEEFDATNQSYSFPGIERLRERVSIDFEALRHGTLNPPLEGQLPDPPVLRFQKGIEKANLSGEEVNVNNRLAASLRYHATRKSKPQIPSVERD